MNTSKKTVLEKTQNLVQNMRTAIVYPFALENSVAYAGGGGCKCHCNCNCQCEKGK